MKHLDLAALPLPGRPAKANCLLSTQGQGRMRRQVGWGCEQETCKVSEKVIMALDLDFISLLATAGWQGERVGRGSSDLQREERWGSVAMGQLRVSGPRKEK